jgi:hypothetical protein
MHAFLDKTSLCWRVQQLAKRNYVRTSCEARTMPRTPPAVDAASSCSFGDNQEAKAENPKPKASKLIAVDIFSSRF